MATMMDVALRAGVSIKTVSRVLNSEAHVRPKLAERVRLAISELGYHPNLAARQLAGNRSYLIAYFYNSFVASYFSVIMVTAGVKCRNSAFHLVSEPIDEGDDQAKVVRRLIEQLRPEGILLSPPFSDDLEIVSAIQESGTPLARLSGKPELYGDSIFAEERTVSRALVGHLVEMGHRRIAFVAPPPDHFVAQGRLHGYREALENAEIAFDPALVIPGTFRFDSGVAAGEKIVAMENPPTAVFAGNDSMAMGVLSVAQRRGIAVPQELAIAGFDDVAVAAMLVPPLSSVRQPLEAMTEAAIEALIAGRPPPLTQFAHKLVLRESTTGMRDQIPDRVVP